MRRGRPGPRRGCRRALRLAGLAGGHGVPDAGGEWVERQADEGRDAGVDLAQGEQGGIGGRGGQRQQPVLQLDSAELVDGRLPPAGSDVVSPRAQHEVAGVGGEGPRLDLCGHLGDEPRLVGLGYGWHGGVVGVLDVDAVEFRARLAVGAVHGLGLAPAALRRVLHPAQDVLLAAPHLGHGTPDAAALLLCHIIRSVQIAGLFSVRPVLTPAPSHVPKCRGRLLSLGAAASACGPEIFRFHGHHLPAMSCGQLGPPARRAMTPPRSLAVRPLSLRRPLSSLSRGCPRGSRAG